LDIRDFFIILYQILTPNRSLQKKTNYSKSKLLRSLRRHFLGFFCIYPWDLRSGAVVMCYIVALNQIAYDSQLTDILNRYQINDWYSSHPTKNRALYFNSF